MNKNSIFDWTEKKGSLQRYMRFFAPRQIFITYKLFIEISCTWAHLRKNVERQNHIFQELKTILRKFEFQHFRKLLSLVLVDTFNFPLDCNGITY